MKKNQTGFGAVQTLLIVVIVGIIGGVGWFVYNSQKKTNDTLSKTSQAQGEPQKTTSKTSAPAVDQTKYLEIKEWGVKLPLTSSIEDAIYALPKGTYDANFPRFGLSTKSLAALDANCGPDGIAAAFLFRQTVATHDTNLTKGDALNNPVYETRLGDYYYRVQGSQAACSESDSVTRNQAVALNAFVEAAKGIKTTQ